MSDVAKKTVEINFGAITLRGERIKQWFFNAFAYTWVDPGNKSYPYIVFSLLIILYVSSMKSDFLLFYSTDTFTHLTLVSD